MILCGAVGLLQTLDSGPSGCYIGHELSQEFATDQQPHPVETMHDNL